MKTRIIPAIIVAAFSALASGSAGAQNLFDPLEGKSADYVAGWCAGMAEAERMSMGNRDHYAAMITRRMGMPIETHAEVMKRLYSDSKAASPQTAVADIVDRVVRTMLDGIDLYVVLPEMRGAFSRCDAR